LNSIWALQNVWGKSAMLSFIQLAKSQEAPSKLRVEAISAAATKLTLASNGMNSILGLYGDSDPAVQKAAEEALAQARDRKSILSIYGIKSSTSGVMKRLGDMHQATSKYNQRINELLKDSDPKAKKTIAPVDAMLAKLSDNDPNVRLAAAYDLGQLKDGKAVPELVKHLTDESNAVVKAAARSIAMLAPLQKPDLKIITPLITNENPVTREQVAYLIGEFGDTDAYDKLVEVAIKEENMRVTRRMAKTLIRTNALQALPTLRSMLIKSSLKSSQTAIECIKAMESFGDPAIPYLIFCMKSKNNNVKSAALYALKSVTGEDFGLQQADWEKWHSTQ
jgi:hypothetical protein